MNDRQKPRRRSIRLKQYDYRRPGAYFVTICTYRSAHLFGDVINQTVELSPFGRVADWRWRNLSRHFEFVSVDAHVVMPNHIHGIIWLGDDPVGAMHSQLPSGQATTAASVLSGCASNIVQENASPLPAGAPSGALGAIVGNFKSTTARRINQMRKTPGEPVWQRNYYEHIIRTEHALHKIRRYITENPHRWTLDRYNSMQKGTDPHAREIWRILRG